MGDVEKAERVGKKYAEEQLASDLFEHWVREELHEGSKLRPDEVMPGLETETIAKDKRAAVRLAYNILQQIRWDIERGLESSVIAEMLGEAGIADPRRKIRELESAFWKGLRRAFTSDATESWVAEEIIMPGAKELMRGQRRARRT